MKKPNIVWVLTDDQGIGDLACTGNKWIKTPNIDSFYDESVHMTNFHVGPTCAPTRSTLMTGHYANSTGVWHTVGGRSLMREDEWTLPSALKEGGYTTGIFGKWHLGDSYPYRPHERGFDKSITHGGGGISQIPDYWGNDYFDDTYYVNGTPQTYKGYCTDVFFNESMDFITENKDNSFFCFITPNAPHGPHNVPKKYYDMYKDDDSIENEKRKRFYGMITNVDDNFGRLISHLESLNILDNTIVIFMTDNGTATGITQNVDEFVVGGYNVGLRGGKNSEYDGGHRVPFFLRYDSAHLNIGKDIDTLTASIDVMPTLLDYCGIEVGAHTFHGTSLVPLLKGDDFANRAVVTDSQRLVNPQKWRKSAVMTDLWRLINGVELYDIHADREQRHDIAGQYPEVVKKLREDYNAWWNIVSERFDEPIPLHFGDTLATLTVHDLRNMSDTAVFRQADVREAKPAQGYWEIEVEKEGTYEIELRRWPRENGRKICEGIDADDNDIFFEKDLIEEEAHCYYSGGKALNITMAYIVIGAHSLNTEVSDKDEKIIFTLDLKSGSTNLRTWFSDVDNLHYGAYYVYAQKLN